MNITELARTLRVPPQELRDKLPLIGFDIGQKAIKVDNRTAKKILKEWNFLIGQLEAREEKRRVEEKTEIAQNQEKKEIKIPHFITVRNFSELAEIPVNQILAELMKNSIFSSLNEKIDFETAAIIGSDLGLEVMLDEALDKKEDGDKMSAEKLKDLLEKEDSSDMKERAPVIVVMGHVDHGKTKLLDAIRRTHVMDGEAGGITQHIGAYQVVRKGKAITFIDTPGHEAFTAMRSRGAKIADIAILVVAADDGVKPQTIEAYRILESAKIPVLVAINKIDKPEANIDKTKQELSNQLKITPEDWGGKTICMPISAKEGAGIDDLLDMVLLTADMESGNIKANPKSSAIGTIIESRVDKGEGPVATVLVQNGTLKIGDQLCFSGQSYGKVRALRNYLGENIEQAEPSVPAKIIGLKSAPKVGDILEVGAGEKIKNKKIKYAPQELTNKKSNESENENIKTKRINLIIKSDVLGSGGAIEESLAKIEIPEIKINIIKKGLGNITESDITQAEASQAQVIGFNVKSPSAVEELARSKNVIVKIYVVIYELINDIKSRIQELVEPEVKRVDLGRLKVLAIFRTEANSQIIGGKAIDKAIEDSSFIDVCRDKEVIASGKLTKLQSGKQDVKSVEADQECGIQYEGKPLIKEGDILQVWKEERITKII
ncbi:translation initiation factor IF-2 [Patescibacteria group bacterium]|nr:translation initiation factor IF-2 [Patescibacteria group bacterium]MBU4600569.1 translation initiation factor IF-2 [Patescibacteria group bacterium]MCG2698139.1 translation initiation factor IF-2 [Candidatus Parcubacteria bacterium]